MIPPDLQELQSNGVVGAGGAGFPTYAKLLRPAEVVVVNAAECEPLMHKDKEILRHYPEEVISGLKRVMGLAHARQGIIGIKNKYTDVIARVGSLVGDSVRVHALGDYYPTGDEFVLVKETVGRVIPPGALPLDVGAVVCNVETLWNVHHRTPVVEKFLTVAGAVRTPCTVRVPVGISYAEAIAAAGGATCPSYHLLIGGPMMGILETDVQRPVTKTCGGFLVLPVDHPLVQRRKMTYQVINRIGKSACDQCSFCTELCPRYLLGHPIEPHKAMRGLVFTSRGTTMVPGTEFCCECNLCSLYACPEGLDPKNVCVQSKQMIRAAGKKHPQAGQPCQVRPMAEGRKTPLPNLIRRLGLDRYDNHGPLRPVVLETRRIVLPKKQHVGPPAEAVVRPGDRVAKGTLVAAVKEGQLGCSLHSSMDGRVTAIDPEIIVEA